MKRYFFSILILTIMGIPAAFSDAAAQQSQSQERKQASGALSQSDRDFITKAAQGGMAEVALGELAARQASNDEVKQFGQRMVDDHTKANNELKDLASKKGIAIQSDLSARHKASHDRLAKLSGADFDREYMSAMVKDHDATVALFEKESRSGGDPELKAWVTNTLPVLREHQKLAHELAGRVGAKTGD